MRSVGAGLMRRVNRFENGFANSSATAVVLLVACFVFVAALACGLQVVNRAFATELSTISITSNKTPVVGESSAGIMFDAGANYTVSTIKWKKDSDTPGAGNKTFADGSTYEVRLTVKPAHEGDTISGASTATVNGNVAAVSPTSATEAVVIYSFGTPAVSVATPYPVWVRGVQVTSANAYDGLERTPCR